MTKGGGGRTMTNEIKGLDSSAFCLRPEQVLYNIAMGDIILIVDSKNLKGIAGVVSAADLKFLFNLKKLASVLLLIRRIEFDQKTFMAILYVGDTVKQNYQFSHVDDLYALLFFLQSMTGHEFMIIKSNKTETILVRDDYCQRSF